MFHIPIGHRGWIGHLQGKMFKLHSRDSARIPARSEQELPSPANTLEALLYAGHFGAAPRPRAGISLQPTAFALTPGLTATKMPDATIHWPISLQDLNQDMTVLEVIQRSTEFLAKKGVESPRLQTELLLAHLLKLPRMQLYLNFERTLTPVEVDAFREFIKRRGQREPLQQIAGSTSFCGLEIAVNRYVLVPRPETELLAEQAWTFLNQLSSPAALDFGTGSGCLAIALAKKSPTAIVSALDLSTEAIALASENAASHSLAERIRFFRGDGFAALPADAQFNLIVSNPPYVPGAEIATLQPEVRDYEPRQALDGGPDGLDYYRRLSSEAPPFVKPGGKIMLEFGDGQEKPIAEIFQRQKWVVEAVIEDYTRRPRILIARL
jgi:release factor glutamine methyltransferase